MRRAIAILAAMGLAGGAILATEPWTRPDWCRPGFVCLPTAVAAEQEATIRELQAQILDLEAKALKTGKCGAGLRWYGGPGFALVGAQEWQDGSPHTILRTGVGGCAGFGWTW